MARNDPPTSWSLLVVELDDVVARRDPAKPNLYVARTVVEPEKRFDTIRKSKKKHWYSSHAVRLRKDLAPSRRYDSQEKAKAAYTRLVKKLTKAGFTVNRDTRVWTVYVIELDSSGVSHPGKGYVYVGETSKTPEARFREHTEGARNKRGRLFSSDVHKHGRVLRPDLAPNCLYFDQESSKRAEKQHAAFLREKGYNVAGGH